MPAGLPEPGSQHRVSPGSLPEVLLALGLLVAVGVAADRLATDGAGRTLAFALVAGTTFGIVLQRTRFCFFCHLRDLIEQRDARGALAILLALAVGTVGTHLIVASWLPVPALGRLPADAHIGPVSPALALAGAAFGLGMAISGSCISAHWYRLGEGSPIAPFALLGAGLGFLLGFNTWNPLYSAMIATAPVIWLPHHVGYAGSVGAQLAAFGLLAWLAWRRSLAASPPPASLSAPAAASGPQAGQPRSLFALLARLASPDRWPYWIGGLVIGWLSTLILLRLRPLGVTAALGGGARELATTSGLMPQRLDGLDQLGGCATATAAPWWQTSNALLIIGLVIGALAMALLSGQFRPRWPTRVELLRGLGGGVLLGWGAMTALGCTIGTLLSGTMAGALSGWVFGLTMLAAVWVGVRCGWAPGIRPASR